MTGAFRWFTLALAGGVFLAGGGLLITTWVTDVVPDDIQLEVTGWLSALLVLSVIFGEAQFKALKAVRHKINRSCIVKNPRDTSY